MIKIHNMKKTFLDKTIFNDFNLEVKSGEFIGVYGKSGQGKTTLLNIIGTLEKPDSGEILIMEKSLENKKTKRYLLRDEIGFIFQNYALIDNETVNNNLEIALKHKKMSKPQKKEAMYSALSEVGLMGYGEKKVHTLSGGEQQRIAIARLLLKDPSIILADEPTGSLDNENRDVIISLFKKLHQKGKTIIVVTHDTSLSHLFSRIIQL
ncbi:putative bacteriocin export ABC transporter [Bacillus hominis]|uniref:Bacteriocin export ABC transporter n=1 Tax=Bacillus hominis TaxID=2817478 RepID=A0ABT7RF92_9BACI|nr:putative bacteriocin export ABC transporter [Bacillus hominis]MDM5191201.1 putative bacteriocin export ABC transporter [Bacillus hominis]MDM5436461.1 putative bacteriocin export ABC transporter [Bacillus hominis]MDM5441601.1 putative bacteriocin export ABC transporter [Bacillus hominis]